MKRMAIALSALLILGGFAHAEEPKFFLTKDGKVEQRVAAVESDVAALKARVADLEKQLNLKVAAEPAAAPAPKAERQRITYRVCVNGRCSDYVTDDPSSVPLGAKILSASASAANCPCGDSCLCGAMSATSESFESGGIWFPGKRVFERVRGGRCR